MFCIFAIHGSIANHILRLNSHNPYLNVIIGFIVQTILLTTLAFFIPIGSKALLLNLLLTGCMVLKYKSQIRQSLQLLLSYIRETSRFELILISVVVVTAALKCAQVPFILDNETYYIQTIRWINEHGFVKGLANFNIAFAQSSGWHILQAGFNASFVTNRLNDINGLLLITFTLWSLSVSRSKTPDHKIPAVTFAILSNVLLYQFINAPSPDLPLILLSQIVFYLYLSTSQQYDKLIILLAFYLVFLKITILPFVFLPALIILQRRSALTFSLGSGLVFLLLYVAKSVILTGYPVYPLLWFPLEVDWRVPVELVQFISDMVYDHEFLGMQGIKDFTWFDRLKIWIGFGGINGLMNKLVLILFAITPLTKNFKEQKLLKHLYVVCLIHFVLVLLTSPQFRFFLPEILFLGTVVLADIVQRLNLQPRTLRAVYIVAVLLPLPVMVFVNSGSITDNSYNIMTDKIHVSQLYLPERNSRYNGKFVRHSVEKLYYYRPGVPYFFYATGDGPFPANSNLYLERMELKYNIRPQMLTDDPGDGYYSKRIK
jgi:hypothetical protein